MDLYLLKFPYRKVLLPAAKKLIWVDPDVLGYVATALTLVTGLCYVFALQNPALLLLAIALTLARMTLNTIDGVIAMEQKKDTLKGEIVNALPDRYSDIFHLGGIALSPLCGGVYGIIGMASMFMVSYTGMLGKAVGVNWQHQGPLGKVERLIMLMVFTLWQYVSVKNGAPEIPGLTVTPLQACMLVFAVLSPIAVFNRLAGQLKEINKLEWIKKNSKESVNKKVLVIYDSATGNTEKVAREIAEPLNADVRKVDEAGSPEYYDAVIIGTPNIRKRPTKKICSWIEANAGHINDYAVFVTYGMPVWGEISKRACFKYVEDTLGKEPLGVFSCRGFHAKYKTYKNHPDGLDLLDAFNFGIETAKKLEKESAIS
jgi:phosphatidylglycerophosphate synthase